MPRPQPGNIQMLQSCFSHQSYHFQNTQWIVPPHASLNLDETICRVPDCSLEFGRPGTRQRHEREVHRFEFRRGVTFSAFCVRYNIKLV